MDLAASLGNHTLLRRLENKAIFNGWLMMKVPRFAGLGCEWQPRFTVVTRRTTPPQPDTTNANAATHHYVLLAYKAEADVTPSCKVWLDGAVCRDNPNPRAIERLNGAFKPAEVVVRLSSRHKKPEGACPRQDSGKTRYLLFFRPLEGTTASVSALRRIMNGVNSKQREDAPQPPSISSLASSDEEVARRLQEEEDAHMARAIANNNREEGGPAFNPTGSHNYSNNHQNLHQAAGGSGSSFGGYPQVNYGDEARVSLRKVFVLGTSLFSCLTLIALILIIFFLLTTKTQVNGLRPAYNSGVQPSAPSAPLLSSLFPTAPLASNLLDSTTQEEEASHPIVSLPSQDPAEFRRSTAPAELQHYAQAAQAGGGGSGDRNSQQENECCVCLNEAKTYAAVHGETMHLSVCRDCMLRFNREGRPCPMCRQTVEKWLRLHD